MKFKNARFLYNLDSDNHFQISDIICVEFSKEKDVWPSHLLKKYQNDFGNSSFDVWPKTSLSDILLHFICIGFISYDVKEKFLLELAKIDEFTKVKKYLGKGDL